jgi:hypothetical protein
MSNKTLGVCKTVVSFFSMIAIADIPVFAQTNIPQSVTITNVDSGWAGNSINTVM